MRKGITLWISICMCWGQLHAQHRSVMIHDGKGICEPSIKVDPSAPERMVAGMVLNYVSYSKDGGEHWSTRKLSSPYGVWGDPVIDIDPDGRFYYFHLSNPADGDWIDRIVCQVSDDGGVTWSDGTYTGLNGAKDQDKHWSVVDPTTGTIHLTWTEFDKYGSKDSTCMSRIQYSRSMDRGVHWDTPVTISTVSGDCIDDDETTEGAVPAVGPDGQVYVTWAGPQGLVFSRSMDKGDTWEEEQILDPMPGGWTYEIPGIYRANGLPVTKCDLSDGSFRGRIYVNWSDQRNGTEDTDVWCMYSDDEGKTWTKPRRVNQDKGASHQFFTWMDVDQSTGEVYFIYYNRRHDPSSWSTLPYMALSVDGTETFVEFALEHEDKAFVPDPTEFFGDYNNLSVHDAVVRPIWTRMDEKKSSVWTSIVDTHRLSDSHFRIPIRTEVIGPGPLCLVVMEHGKKRKVGKWNHTGGTVNKVHILDASRFSSAVVEIRLLRDDEILWSREIEINGRTDR